MQQVHYNALLMVSYMCLFHDFIMILVYGLPLVCPASSLVLWPGISKLNSKAHMLKVTILSHVFFPQTKSIGQENRMNIKFSLTNDRNSSRFERKIGSTVRFFT